MTELRNRKDRKDLLTERAIRFFNRYDKELESVGQLLKIRLDQLASAYTAEVELPKEAVEVHYRIKSLTSLLSKLDRIDWPMFHFPTDVITDLVGARVICWFIDDCYGMLDYIQATKQFRIRPRSLEDYIKGPKRTGYRSIHILADISYDRVKTDRKQRIVVEDRMVCEIQIRTKLQNAWAEFTHDLHHNIPSDVQEDYETAIAEIAQRLDTEDRSALVVRDILRRQATNNQLDDLGSD
jgi:putative GTP pyrophosphokinase